MPDIKSALNNPRRAAASALIQRQAMTMSGLLNESEAAYKSAEAAGLLTGDIGKNSGRAHMGEDAFRHAYASARATQELGSAIANTLGRGNEWFAAALRENSDDHANAADIGMDLHNNKVGREIANKLGPRATPEQVRDAVIAAGNRGDLILSPLDTRALKEYANQHDMVGLAVVHDAVAPALSAAKETAASAWDKAKETAASAWDKTKGVVDSTHGMASEAGKRLEEFGKSLSTALERDGRSPFFLFSEAELKEGERVAALVSPALLATVERTVDFGPEMSLDRDTLKDIMHPVEQFAQNGQEQKHDHTNDMDGRQLASAERESRHDEAEHEMEHDVA